MTLTDSQRETVLNALRIAVGACLSDAALCRREGQTASAEASYQSAIKYGELALRIEAAEEVLA